MIKVAALVSGGKDGLAALHRAADEHQVVGLLAMSSHNRESYMFHTHNTSLVGLQAKAMGLPLLTEKTAGNKEEELSDLKKLLKKAKEDFEIQGVVSGAIRSNYQRTRLERICRDLDLKSLTPLWHVDELEYMQGIATDFKTIVVAVAAAGLDDSWLGRSIDQRAVAELAEIRQRQGINLAFEGGEAETLVLWAPRFRKEIKIEDSQQYWDGTRGRLEVEEASLVVKGDRGEQN